MHIRTTPNVGCSTNILLQCWLFLLLLNAEKNKLSVKENKQPTEFERVHCLWQIPENFSCSIHFDMLRKQTSLYENTTHKNVSPSLKRNSSWGCPAPDLRMHGGLAQRAAGSAAHRDKANLVTHLKLLCGQQAGAGNASQRVAQT